MDASVTDVIERPSSPKDRTRIKVDGQEIDRKAIPRIPLSPRTESRELNPAQPMLPAPAHLSNRLTTGVGFTSNLADKKFTPVSITSSSNRGKMSEPSKIITDSAERIKSPRSQERGPAATIQTVSPDTIGQDDIVKKPASPATPVRRLKSPFSPAPRTAIVSPEPKKEVLNRIKPPNRSPGISERSVSPSISIPIPKVARTVTSRPIVSPVNIVSPGQDAKPDTPVTKPISKPVVTRPIKPDTNARPSEPFKVTSLETKPISPSPTNSSIDSPPSVAAPSPKTQTTKLSSPRTSRVKTPENKILMSPGDLDNVFVMPTPRESGVIRQNIRDIVLSPSSREDMRLTPQGFNDNARSPAIRREPNVKSVRVKSPKVKSPRKITSPTTIKAPISHPMSPRDAVPSRMKIEEGQSTVPITIPSRFRTPEWEQQTSPRVMSRSDTPDYASINNYTEREGSMMERSPMSRRKRVREQLRSPRRNYGKTPRGKTPRRRTRKRRKEPTPEPEAFYNPTLNKSRRPRPDYEAMDPEEIEMYRNDIRNKMSDIRDAFPKFQVPIYDTSVPLDTIHTVYEQYYEQVQIEHEVAKYRWILTLGFFAIEKLLMYFFRLDTSHFSDIQADNMPQYEYFLRQMCQRNGGTGIGSDWSPEVKIGVISGVQLILVILVNKFVPENIMPREYINEGFKLVASFISSENMVIDGGDGGTGTGIPMMPESDMGILSSIDPVNLTKMGGGFVDGLINGQQKRKPDPVPSDKSPGDAPRRGRRNRVRRGPQHGP